MKNHTYFNMLALVLGLTLNPAQASLLAIDMLPGGGIDSSLETTAGSIFDVNVVVNDTLDLTGFDFTLDFDSSILEVNSISSGNFWGLDTEQLLVNIDNLNGFFNFAEGKFASPQSGIDVDASTYAVLATVQFTVLADGFSALGLGNIATTVLSDANGNEITPVSQLGGQVAVVPLPPAVLLFGSTLLGLIGMRKTRQSC